MLEEFDLVKCAFCVSRRRFDDFEAPSGDIKPFVKVNDIDSIERSDRVIFVHHFDMVAYSQDQPAHIRSINQ